MAGDAGDINDKSHFNNNANYNNFQPYATEIDRDRRALLNYKKTAKVDGSWHMLVTKKFKFKTFKKQDVEHAEKTLQQILAANDKEEIEKAKILGMILQMAEFINSLEANTGCS